MKKIVFLLVAAIAAGAVSAQKPFTFGPKVGINVTVSTTSITSPARNPRW